MSEYVPDKWVIIKIEGKNVPLTYKVFACWFGGYLGSNSWKLNSGITKVTKDGEFYLYKGHSGSVYRCHKEAYGTHMYGSGILNDIINKSEEIGVKIEILSENTNWLDLSYNVE
jgi:hypothetical protein